jgi:hypothetical protein
MPAAAVLALAVMAVVTPVAAAFAFWYMARQIALNGAAFRSTAANTARTAYLLELLADLEDPDGQPIPQEDADPFTPSMRTPRREAEISAAAAQLAQATRAVAKRDQNLDRRAAIETALARGQALPLLPGDFNWRPDADPLTADPEPGDINHFE